MYRVGLCTLYFNNQNYGANLQAYALRKIVASMGYDVEMIAYYNFTAVHRVLSEIKRSVKKNAISKELCIRKAAVIRFNKSIPHSRLYYSNTIKQANRDYDVFITGSDQVWNPDWINPYMSLEFVHRSKRTIAYAASVGKIHLDEEQQKKLRRALENTDCISIREKESIPALQELTTKRIEHVLDPTLMLARKDWDAICSERRIKDDYMFCYFLGGNNNLRKVAKEYASDRGLKIAALPYLNGQYRTVDDGFADYPLYDVSPEDFLSLIRHSSFVLTDSFHGAVFSHLYEREFAVSSERGNEMGCRLNSLTELFGTEERYIDDHEAVSLDRLMSLENSPLKLKWDQYEEMRQKSLAFLKEALEND